MLSQDMDLKSPTKRQSRIASSTTATVEDELVPSLWQQLPPDLCEKVLSKLPLFALRKFSRVSKRWKTSIRSVEFACECESIEWTFFYLDLDGEISYMLLPNLKTDSWDRYSLDFLDGDECIAAYRVADYHVAADGGLLCYRICKKRGFDPWITLVVQNPLTRKWRRLIVPHQDERGLYGHKMMWGLKMDKESGSYKVVVAFCDQYLSRKAFIYDSVSNSWSISATLTPVLVSHFNEVEWEIRSIVCSRDELLWLIEEWGAGPFDSSYRWLIKYNFELDVWSMVTQQSPFLLGERIMYLVHHDVEDRPMMVNFQDSQLSRPQNLPSSARFPSKFLELVPDLGKIGIEDIERLASEAGDTEWLADFNPKEVAFGGGTWYIVSYSYRSLPDFFPASDVFAVSENPPAMTRLPNIYGQGYVRVGIFAATLKAFV